ncbi:sulfoacetaldehyde dehydrogenase [Halobacteriales archaeon QS_8_69_73]|nr:MAG: sulfoacetaldehyde dehydrogenase [Halobacteriales archaeon QS_8_69_73]
MRPETTGEESASPAELVTACVQRARDAMDGVADYNQQQADELVRAVGWAAYERERCRELSELAVETTGLGDVDDKFAKKRRKIPGAMAEMLGEETIGVVDVDEEHNLVEIAKPVGVVGAVVPSTNPGATPALLTMMAVKSRNAIVLSPSPRGRQVCERFVEYVHEQLAAVGAPRDLVQLLPTPITKDKTYELMDRVDVLQVTGSADNVRAGQESGTPNYCVGKGNPVGIVDETADVSAAAERIATSKSFDNSTSCSSEGNVVVVDDVYDETVRALERAGGYSCDDAQRHGLRELLFPDGETLNADALAVPPAELTEMAGIDNPSASAADFLMVRGQGVGPDYPLAGEKITPVLNVFRVEDIDEAFALTREILDYEGAGHSTSIHTSDRDRAVRAGREIDVARLLVNQVHSHSNGGRYDNGLGSTLSEGAGTWGGNQLDENVTYEQFYQTTTVTRPIPDATEPDPEALFEPYLG